MSKNTPVPQVAEVEQQQPSRPVSFSKKSIADAYLWAFPLGLFGLHRFYLGQKYLGIAYLFSGGLFGIGWLHDLLFMPRIVNNINRIAALPPPKKRYNLVEAYILCLNPAGILFGLHQFYLGRKGFGTMYCFTVGIFGVGWLSDIIRMPKLVADANQLAAEIEANPEVANQKQPRKIDDAYVLWVFGFFGLHHFYLGNIGFGFAYLFTVGMGGVGWLVDFFRMPALVARANDPHPSRLKRLDDAYILTFPLGFLGLQHFYLGRPGWGIAYMFTFGLAGFGFLIDIIRMPFLVKQVNESLVEQQNLVTVVVDNNYNGNQLNLDPSVGGSGIPYQAPSPVIDEKNGIRDNTTNYTPGNAYPPPPPPPPVSNDPPPPPVLNDPPPAYESKANLRQ